MRALLNASSLPYDGRRGYRLCLYFLTIAGIVFRSELAILVGTISLYLLATKRISITGVIIPAGIGGLVIGLLCTVPLDSFFWQSFPLWPEWTAFYYNTIQGHSADWGISPWHYYFSNALPRLMLNPATYLLCIPVAVTNTATRQRSLALLIPILGFIGLYSLLPHKEWRFIIYAIPGFTGVAAAGASWIWTRRAKSAAYAAVSLVLVGSVVASFAASSAVLALSSLNYPGGVALDTLHRHTNHDGKAPLKVHFGNLACQTGVTRFLESHSGASTVVDALEVPNLLAERTWIYDKTEDSSALLDPMFWVKFDYVLAEKPEKIIGSWAIAHTVYGYAGLRILKPGQQSGSVQVDHLESLSHGTADPGRGWTDEVARWWRALEEVLRDKVLRGYWAEIRMEPKIHVLVNQKPM